MGNRSSSTVNHGQFPSKTASRSITEPFTVTHDFEVTNFPLLVDMGVGRFVESSTFSVGGFLWNMRVYPDGVTKEDADEDGNASVVLRYLSTAKVVKTKISLSFLQKDGQIAPQTDNPVDSHIFSPDSAYWGNNFFYDKSSWHLHDGCLRIRCVLTVIKTYPTEELTRNVVVAPQSNLKDHLKQMLTDGDGADVTFSVRGELFNAHRCLLAARSPAFKAELFGPMKEKSTQCIEVDDMEPPIFEALLHFMYMDCITDDYAEGKTRNLQHLLVAADRYELDRLRLMCEGRLCDSIDVETVATTLVLAEQHNCQVLREACLDFLASRNALDEVMKTDGFRHLQASCPRLMLVILSRMLSI